MNSAVLVILFLVSLSAHSTSFLNVRDLIRSQNPSLPMTSPEKEVAQAEVEIYRTDKLPSYPITFESVFKVGKNLLALDSKRTIEKSDDSFLRIQKLIHASGICFTGEWMISESTPYSGVFKKDTHALFVGRASTATGNTVSNHARAFGLAGKIFPTLNESEDVSTLNFFAVDSAFGTDAKHYLDTAMTNQPATGIPAFADVLKGIPFLGLKIAGALGKADRSVGFRPLYPLSIYGIATPQDERTPHWIMIKAAPGQARVDESDFRNELNISKNYPTGITEEIYVSDLTPSSQDLTKWQRIGQIVLKESFVSYGCDRQLHFHHPKMRPQDN